MSRKYASENFYMVPQAYKMAPLQVYRNNEICPITTRWSISMEYQ